MSAVSKTIKSFLMIAVLGATASCGDDADPIAASLTPCTGDVSVSVTAGVTPVFTWSPACLIDEFLVEPTARGIGDRWSFHGSAGPSITYGVTPAGATTFGGPEPLLQGSEYRVVMRHSASPSFLAIHVFRP